MNESIYVTALKQIPKGETRSFGEIAALAGKPKAARAAGRVLSSYPAEGKAAWQRAVTTDGGLSIDPERARVQLERLRRDGARPREGEAVVKWAKRVRAPFVGYYKTGLFFQPNDPRVNKFDPLCVERIGSEVAGLERGFQHVEDHEMNLRDEAEIEAAEARARRKVAVRPKKKVARR